MTRALLVLTAIACLCPPAAAQSNTPANALRDVPHPGLAHLRWLEGTWRGRLPDGGAFYERYTFVDDSTIAMAQYTDSTLSGTREGDRLRLRGGVLRYENVWASELTPSSVAFRSADGRFGFTWVRTSDSTWTATIREMDAAGRPRTTVYPLTRYAGSGGAAAADREGVRQAVLDYVEGFYEGDSTRLLRSIWPQVLKYGYARSREAASTYDGMQMRFPTGFLDYARAVRDGRVRTPPDAPKEIVIFDVQDQTASAKLRAWWGTDYLLLAREDGRWMITHVLWQASGSPAG